VVFPTTDEFMTLDTPTLPAGTYRISWYYLWAFTATNSAFKAIIQIDDTTTILDHQQTPMNGSSTERHQASGFFVTDLTAGAHFIDLDFARVGAQGTAFIHQGRLEIERVDLNGEA
jgi:hypothetical protein